MIKNNMNQIIITKSSLIQDVANGLRKEDIQAKYSTTTKLTRADVTKMLRQSGLKIKRQVTPKFILIDNTELPGNPEELKEIVFEAKKGNYEFITE